MAFEDVFEIVFTIRNDLKIVFGLDTPLTIMTDSLSLFDARTDRSTRTEKRLTTNLQAVQAAYKEFKNLDIAFIKSEYGLSGSLKKVKKLYSPDRTENSEISH